MKLVAYLAGADYKVRLEEEVDDKKFNENEEEVKDKLQEKLIELYGKYWKDKTQNQIKVKKVFSVKNYKRKGKKIKGYTKTHSKWSSKETKKALLLDGQDYSYKEISRILKRPYNSVKTKIQRLKGIKKT